MTVDMSPRDALQPSDYARVVAVVRRELQEAGNPVFAIAIHEADGAVELAPMVYAAVGPAGDYARRMEALGEPGETVLLVARQAQATRLTYDVLEPTTLRRLHLLHEAVEASVHDRDTPR